MNVLPTGPDSLKNKALLKRYFEDMKRWNFDVAYSAFYAFPFKELKGSYKERYIAFTEMAHKCGFKACIQIQSTVGFSDDVSLKYAQHYLDNSVYIYQHFPGWGRKNFFGSFASNGWLEYIKEIATIFRGYGFDWVVFEEPMYRVDIPGTKDAFYKEFMKRYPNVKYPTRQDESLSYLLVQKLKRDILVEFYDTLAVYSKKIGYEKMGIMPWFFSPTFENTPSETWNSCCDIGRLTFLKDLDFVIVRMQPDNIWANAMMDTGGESLPRLGYLEVLAHSLGKPIIAVNNPTNEHHSSQDMKEKLLPLDYFKKYTLSALAAAPDGMTRHWYPKNYGEDIDRMQFMKETNKYISKLGKAASPIAFVFSYSGISHILPKSWKDVWKSYWNFARKLLYEEKTPFLTFFGETLRESLARHPEIRIIVLNEYFPINKEEILLLKKWISEDSLRRLLYFGGRWGYRYDWKGLYNNFEYYPPEMLELFGIDSNKEVEIVAENDYVEIEFCGNKKADAFWGDKVEIGCAGYCIPAFKKSNALKIFYQKKANKIPLVTSYKYKNGGEALYCGISLDGDLNIDLRNLLIYLLINTGKGFTDFPVIKEASRGILWNITQNNYFVVCNNDDKSGLYKIELTGKDLYDVKKKIFVNSNDTRRIAPLDFHIYRVVGKNENVIDVENIVYLDRVEHLGGEEILSLFPGPGCFVKILLRKLPGNIFVSNQKVRFKSEQLRGGVEIKIKNLPQQLTQIKLVYE